MKYWKKNLIFIWICQFLAMAGMSAVVPFLPLYIRELGVTNVNETAQWSGLVFSGPFVLSFFLTPFWGSLGDKHGRKLLTIRAIFGLGLAQILVGLSQNVTQLFLARLLQGALSGFTPAAMALVAANTPEEKNSYALGILQMGVSSGNILGPMIGGLLADIAGYRFVFFTVAGLLFITGILFILFVKEEKMIKTGSKVYNLRENISFALNNKSIRVVLLIIALTSFGFAFIRPIFVLYFETYGISEKYFATLTGVIYGVTGIFSALSSAWWGKKAGSIGYKKVLILTSLLCGTMYALHTFIYDPVFLIPVRIALGVGFGGMLPILFAIVSGKTPVDRKSGVLGIGSSSQTLGNILGPALSGSAASFAGLRFPFIVSSLSFFVIAALSWKKIRK